VAARLQAKSNNGQRERRPKREDLTVARPPKISRVWGAENAGCWTLCSTLFSIQFHFRSSFRGVTLAAFQSPLGQGVYIAYPTVSGKIADTPGAFQDAGTSRSRLSVGEAAHP
jgi:hypothetical protein